MSTKVKERPIILCGDEVQALLAGDKTQHRVPFYFKFIEKMDGIERVAAESDMTVPELITDCYNECVYDFECPFGVVGDRLWVQEDHRPVNWNFDDGDVQIEYRDGTKRWVQYLTDEEFETNPNDDYLIEICDELIARGVPLQDGKGCFDFSNPDNLPHWRSADVMPRFASRILLEITSIRIERVQDISEADALAMGVKSMSGHAWGCALDKQRASPTGFKSPARFLLRMLWREWHGKDSWDCNPWVWVIEFKKVDS